MKFETYSVNSDALVDNDLLQFSNWLNVSDNGEPIPARNQQGAILLNTKGEIIYKSVYKKAYYEGLQIRVYESRKIQVQGSIHKYFNSSAGNGEHNFNDFTLNDVKNVITDLEHKFGFVSSQCQLRCLELGVNFLPPILAKIIMDNSFLHIKSPFERKFNSDEGNYSQVKHSQYIVKLYDKRLHYVNQGYVIDEERIRLEVKFMKMEKLISAGIRTLEDLKSVSIEFVKELLLNEFDRILFYDTTIVHPSASLKNYKNPNYWTELKATKHPNTFVKHKKKLNEITEGYSDNVKVKIRSAISDKLDNILVGGV